MDVSTKLQIQSLQSELNTLKEKNVYYRDEIKRYRKRQKYEVSKRHARSNYTIDKIRAKIAVNNDQMKEIRKEISKLRGK